MANHMTDFTLQCQKIFFPLYFVKLSPHSQVFQIKVEDFILVINNLFVWWATFEKCVKVQFKFHVKYELYWVDGNQN